MERFTRAVIRAIVADTVSRIMLSPFGIAIESGIRSRESNDRRRGEYESEQNREAIAL